MQVRKYEATTIKEAVDLVKEDLGPDAIILSTRESANKISGELLRKVIITAAVEEQKYNKKKVVEENLTSNEKEKLMRKPAKMQREFINQVYAKLEQNIENKRRRNNQVNYAMILDDEELFEKEEAPAIKAKKIIAKTKAQPIENIAKKRVASAIKEAAKISLEKELTPGFSASREIGKISELKKEIKRLQDVVAKMSHGNRENIQNADYPGAKAGVPSDTAPLFKQLVDLGIEEELAANLMKQAKKHLGEEARKKSLLDAWVARWILSRVKVVSQPLQSRYQFFIGPRGKGKTSALVKMASHLAIKEKKKIAIITSDSNKVGAIEQLKIYSQILNVPFAVWRRGERLNDYIKQLSNVDHILFDTSGYSLLKASEMDELREFVPADLGSTSVHLVLSSMLKDEEIYSVARRFKMINYDDIILTNLDQIHRHGLLVNLYEKAQVPYFAFCNGPMIPEDYEWASKERILDYIFKISKSTRSGGAYEK